jgi:hypothetical protein
VLELDGEDYLIFENSGMALGSQRLLKRVRDLVRDAVLIQKMNFLLRRMDIDINIAGVDLQATRS